MSIKIFLSFETHTFSSLVTSSTIYAFRRRRQAGRQEEIFELSLQESLRQAQLLSVGQGEHVALQGDNVVIVRDGQPISIMRSSLQDQRTMEFFENRTQERRNKLIEILLPTTMVSFISPLGYFSR